ncbi:MAG: hypothetical protein ABGY72_07260 [bacterium]
MDLLLTGVSNPSYRHPKLPCDSAFGFFDPTGIQITDLWLGEATDPLLATASDMNRALRLTILSGLVVAVIGCGLLLDPELTRRIKEVFSRQTSRLD